MPAPLVCRVQVVPPSVVVMIGGSVLGIVWPLDDDVEARRDARARVGARDRHQPGERVRPAGARHRTPGVVIGVVCHVQVAPPSVVLTTWA